MDSKMFLLLLSFSPGKPGVLTGSHLHFELQDGTLYLNPIYYVDIG